MAEPIGSTQTFLQYLQLFWANRASAGAHGNFCGCCKHRHRVSHPCAISVGDTSDASRQSVRNGLGLLAAMAERSRVGGLGGVAGDLLGLKSSGALFIGILASDTVEDGLIDKFQLKKVYHVSKIEDARKELAEHTDIVRGPEERHYFDRHHGSRPQTRGGNGPGIRDGVGSAGRASQHFFCTPRAPVPRRTIGKGQSGSRCSRHELQRFCKQEHRNRHSRAGEGDGRSCGHAAGRIDCQPG